MFNFYYINPLQSTFTDIIRFTDILTYKLKCLYTETCYISIQHLSFTITVNIKFTVSCPEMSQSGVIFLSDSHSYLKVMK